jgi:hypothetical protein
LEEISFNGIVTGSEFVTKKQLEYAEKKAGKRAVS